MILVCIRLTDINTLGENVLHFLNIKYLSTNIFETKFVKSMCQDFYVTFNKTILMLCYSLFTAQHLL